jgi:putative ABC transport system substrate-binding protein
LKYTALLLTVTGYVFFLAPYAGAQHSGKTLPRIGVISSTGTAESPWPLFDAFRAGLNDLGYVEGKNILIESRYAEGRLDRMPRLVSELVQQRVDVILAVNNVIIRAAKDATKTIPIVMISSVDPVAAGYIDSFARPGGNITGLANLGRDLSAKRVELLRELLPNVSRFGVIWDADGPGPVVAIKEYEAAARAFKLDLRSVPIRGPNPDLAGALQTAKTNRFNAIIVVANPLTAQHAKQLFDLATKYRLASMTEEGRFVHAGGLISYGASFVDLYRRAAGYVVEILNGAKPGEMAVKLPSKFEVFVNLKTAEKLGIPIPQHILVQADKVLK